MRQASNQSIANILREIGLILEAEDVAFKPQAYATAADTVEQAPEELWQLYKKCGAECIDALPGIGASIAEKIEELLTTGRLAYYDALKKKYPVDMLALTSIANVGPKTAVTLYRELGVKNLRALERAARKGLIRKIPGFGRRSEELILRGLGFLNEQAGRFRLHDALHLAETVVAQLKKLPGVISCEAAGSIRRRKETVGDIDILLLTSKPTLAAEAFVALPEIADVTEQGPTLIRVRFRFGVGGDLRILEPETYGSALVHFTGSKEHNILLRELAIKKGMKLSEYGLFKGEKHLSCPTEEKVYSHLGMPWVPPEIREGGDEVKAALKNTLPNLIPYGSIQGDLQVQTDWTDGAASIEEMAKEAKARGLSYIAITDHTQTLAVAGGLNEKRLTEQGKEIDRVNKTLRGFRVLKSTECDVRKDGNLDLNLRALKTLDIVSVSIHSFFGMAETEMTERMICAMKHPLVNIFFHPTGRVINAREPYALDMPRVLRAAKEYGVAMEINGSDRLDLKDTHVRMAVELGVKLVINSDAHAPDQYNNIAFGISQARRGWATTDDVLNTKPAETLLHTLKEMKQGR